MWRHVSHAMHPGSVSALCPPCWVRGRSAACPEKTFAGQHCCEAYFDIEQGYVRLNRAQVRECIMLALLK